MRKKILLCTVIFGLITALLTADEKPDALVLYKQHNYDKAIEVCLQELEVMPRNMNSYAVLGWSLLKSGKYQEALDYGLKAREVSHYDDRIIDIIGEAYFFLGKNEAALEAFEQYVALFPSGRYLDAVYYYMGETYIRLGEYYNADISLSTAVYHSPNIGKWWVRLGYAREQSEDYGYAVEAYDKALALTPSNSEARRGKERASRMING